MIDAVQSQSMLKRTLIAIGAMLGASVVFVGVLTLVLLAIADRAVSSSGPDSQDRASASVPAAGAPTTAPRPAAAPKTTGGRS